MRYHVNTNRRSIVHQSIKIVRCKSHDHTIKGCSESLIGGCTALPHTAHLRENLDSSLRHLGIQWMLEWALYAPGFIRYDFLKTSLVLQLSRRILLCHGLMCGTVLRI